jgi:anti-sigma factor RsiW
MSSFLGRHSAEGYLVRYLDGELSARKARQVGRHLEACSQCRAELEELKNTVVECVRYRQDVLAAHLPQPPQPWRDLYRDFSRIDEALARESLLVRLMRPLVHSGAPGWAFAAGLAMLIVLGITYQLRQAPSVQAATILSKAVELSESKPPAARHIRVRTSHRQEFTRMAGMQAVFVQVADVQAVAALFAAAHYDWNDPLSARAFAQWRDAQPVKTDEVIQSRSSTEIRTTAAEGELAVASITLRNADYCPSEERLEFRDREWIELSELAEPLTVVGGGSVDSHVGVPVRAAEPPSRSAAFSPSRSASISEELQVLSALNAIEADLGDPVEVDLLDGRVVVTGHEGIPPQRQQAIRQRLAAIPDVDVEFSPTQSATVPPEAVAGSGGTAAGNVASPFQARLEKQLGGHAEFDRFSAELLDLDDLAMQRVYALRRLAQKFSPEMEAGLSAKDLAVLHEMSRKHTAVLAEKVNSMEHLLVPTLSSLGGTAASVRPAAHPAWQPAAEDVYRNARRVEVLVSQMLGMTPGASSGSALPTELMAALKDLQGNLDDCQRFLPAR